MPCVKLFRRRRTVAPTPWPTRFTSERSCTAESLFESVNSSPGLAVIGIVTVLGLVGPLVGYVGLARAGVLSWWLLVPAVAALAASASMEFSPLPFAAFALVGAVAPVAVGLRLIQRNRAEATA